MTVYVYNDREDGSSEIFSNLKSAKAEYRRKNGYSVRWRLERPGCWINNLNDYVTIVEREVRE